MSASSDRLYYVDSYCTRFEASVVDRLTWEGHPAVVLDATAFYPTSGGQPSDRGHLAGVPVIGVEVREEDGAVIHLLARELPEDRVVGEIDWERRFDHMQQHTGQHLLSAGCEQLLDAETVSFHLGSEICTIDLDVPRLPPAAMEPVEALVNRAIWEDRAVTARFVGEKDLSRLPLRHPPQVEGPIRLVEVAGFDLNPCGGTHVAHTGEIGLLKVIRLEYRGEETRVEFLCGGRALHDYDRKNGILLHLASRMTVGYWELEEAVDRMEEELKETRRRMQHFQERALEMEAVRLVETAPSSGSVRVVHRILEGRPAGELRLLAHRMAEHPGVVALLASLEDRTHLCVARSEGVDVDATEILRALCDRLEGKGGGRPHLAQGSGPQADRDRVEAVFQAVASNLFPELYEGTSRN